MNKLRYSAIGCALPIFIYVMVSMAGDLESPLFAKGQIQSGHAELKCKSCHQKNPGTYRQQFQANVHYQLGMRETPVDFGYAKVNSKQCLSCHDRPNERHPIYRFQEPRFISAIAKIDAKSCLGCHGEHKNRRANDNIIFCSACHSDLILSSDPLDVPHQKLISNKQWDTCLGCHDFHGNHIRKAPKSLEQRHAVKAIRDYLASGPSLYGDGLHFEAKKQ